MQETAFIGVGSAGFTTAPVRDPVTFPAFDTAELCLTDVNGYHLRHITKRVERIKRETDSHNTVTAAVLSLREIREMRDALFEKNRDFWGDFQ